MKQSHPLSYLFCALIIWCTGVPGTSAQGYMTNGSASLLSGNCYQLTPDQGGLAGSVFSTSTIDLTQPFSLSCVFFFGCKDAQGADGIVFILATSSSSLGTGGGGIGYENISPSIAIEYDDYQNGWGDPAQDHMAILSNGVLDHNAPTNLAGPTVINEMEDCVEHCFSVNWDPVAQTLTGDLDGQIISYTGNIIASIFSGNPNVYFGFSSGTGSLSNQHIVCIGPPVLDPMDDVTICEGENAQLNADNNGVAWQWTPDPTLSATNIQNPTAMPVNSTLYQVAIDYPCGGSAMDDVFVTVNPAPSVMASNDGPVCTGDDLSLIANGGTNYLWSGPGGFFSNLQNPQILNVTQSHSGTYVVTVTDAEGCSAEASTQVFVHPPVMVMIDPLDVPVCENGEPIQLGANPGGGSWTGDVGPSGVFDPVSAGAGLHQVYYTVTDANGCSGTDTLNIEVVPNTPALIIPEGPFCLNDPVQILSATPGGGIWGEAGDPNGVIDPAILGPGVHPVTYIYSDQNGCFDAEIFIEIFDVPEVTIEPVPFFCPDDTIFIASASPAGGAWGGAITSNGTIHPLLLDPGTYIGSYSLTNQDGCTDSDSIEIVILPDPPVVSNLSVTCDSLGSGFVVSFEINAGDPSTYAVTGSPAGTLISGSPYVFVSDTIPQGGSYSYVVDDLNQCDPTTISGSFSCSCATEPGTMNTTPISVCEGDTVIVPPVSGAVLDMDDTLLYVLHHGNGNFLDDVIVSNSTGEFFLRPPMQPGVTYYVSAVVGNTGGPLGVDLNDPCLGIAPGTPVQWTALPDGYLMGSLEICASEKFVLEFILVGNGPFSVQYSDGIDTIVLDSIQSGHVIEFQLSQSTTFNLLGVLDLSGPGCAIAPDTAISVTVHSEPQVSQSIGICEGDSVFLAGALQGVSGVYIDTFNTVHGCDSVVETTLNVHALSVTQLFDTSCDSMQAGEFVSIFPDQNGCDSTVILNVSYAFSDTTFLQGTTCDPQESGEFTEAFVSSDGCDSIVIETISLLPTDTTMSTATTCDSASAGVFTTTLQNQSGCDSVVIETIALNPSWMTETEDVTCDPVLAGVTVHQYLTSAGCDSVLVETILLLDSDFVIFSEMTCEPADTGIVEMHFINAGGCDSVVTLITTLAPAEVCEPAPERHVYIPNVFSPNFDYINDFFTVYANPDLVRVNYLRIYDRWGAEMYSDVDFVPGSEERAWDGTFRGKPLGPSVFVWVAEVVYDDGLTEVFYGDVTLIR